MRRLSNTLRFAALSLLALSAAIEKPAHAFSILTLGAGVRGDIQSTPVDSHLPLWKVGGGVLFGPRIQWFEIQTGALYVPVGTRLSGAGGESQAWTNYVQVPFLLRLTGRHFSLGGGVYRGFAMTAESTSGSGPVSVSVPTSQTLKDDFGFMAVFGLRMPLERTISFVLDFAYEAGLTNISVGSDSVRTRNGVALAGFAFRL